MKNETMSHYLIMGFNPGKGNYGTDWQTLEDRKMAFNEASQLAQSYRNLLRTKVQVFKGVNLGKLVTELSDI